MTVLPHFEDSANIWLYLVIKQFHCSHWYSLIQVVLYYKMFTLYHILRLPNHIWTAGFLHNFLFLRQERSPCLDLLLLLVTQIHQFVVGQFLAIFFAQLEGCPHSTSVTKETVSRKQLPPRKQLHLQLEAGLISKSLKVVPKNAIGPQFSPSRIEASLGDQISGHIDYLEAVHGIKMIF